MFIHWGPYSLASVEASWPIMRPKPGGITEAEYRALPARFNPTKFDPQAFVDLARSAGQKYMVFTTKHHDGFCMFDSAYTEHKITNTPYGKDIVAQLVAAAKHSDMPYSPVKRTPQSSHALEITLWPRLAYSAKAPRRHVASEYYPALSTISNMPSEPKKCVTRCRSIAAAAASALKTGNSTQPAPATSAATAWTKPRTP